MTKKPNIVYVLTDDQGYGDLECTGNKILKTPSINEVYNNSVHFTNFHVGPTCAPTRSGLLTGHFANSTGVWNTVGGRSLLRKDEWTLSTALKENGYKTAIFGKWHLGDSYPYRAMDRGFDTSIVHGGGAIGHTPDYWGNDYFDDTYMVNGTPKKFNGYCTDVFFDEAIKYIEENKDVPFFCYIPCNAPHNPWNVEDKYAEPYAETMGYRRSRLYGMIANVDENVGKLRNKLKELNLSDNTIFIFMTDNGTNGGFDYDEKGLLMGGQAGYNGYNAGLRGAKGSEYDGGHRVPFFISYPHKNINGGKDINTLTANVDFMPTLLDLCDIEVPQDKIFHGKSIAPLFADEVSQEFQASMNERMVVTDSQRILVPRKWKQSAVMQGEWRLINGKELYNLDSDREQLNNLAEEYPDKIKSMRYGYEEWWKIVSPKFNDSIPFSIGKIKAELTTHDSINADNPELLAPYHQGLIRDGMIYLSHFEILVEEKGCYKFQFRRWPKEAGHPINGGIQGPDVEYKKEFIQKDFKKFYSGGNALPINSCTMEISNIKETKPVNDNDKYVEFEVNLEQGETLLRSVFTGDNDYKINTYYVYVEKI